MDWETLLSPITSAIEGHVVLAVTGLLAMIAVPILVKISVAVAAQALAWVNKVFS